MSDLWRDIQSRIPTSILQRPVPHYPPSLFPYQNHMFHKRYANRGRSNPHLDTLNAIPVFHSAVPPYRHTICLDKSYHHLLVSYAARSEAQVPLHLVCCGPAVNLEI